MSRLRKSHDLSRYPINAKKSVQFEHSVTIKRKENEEHLTRRSQSYKISHSEWVEVFHREGQLTARRQPRLYAASGDKNINTGDQRTHFDVKIILVCSIWPAKRYRQYTIQAVYLMEKPVSKPRVVNNGNVHTHHHIRFRYSRSKGVNGRRRPDN